MYKYELAVRQGFRTLTRLTDVQTDKLCMVIPVTIRPAVVENPIPHANLMALL